MADDALCDQCQEAVGTRFTSMTDGDEAVCVRCRRRVAYVVWGVAALVSGLVIYWTRNR